MHACIWHKHRLQGEMDRAREREREREGGIESERGRDLFSILNNLYYNVIFCFMLVVILSCSDFCSIKNGCWCGTERWVFVRETSLWLRERVFDWRGLPGCLRYCLLVATRASYSATLSFYFWQKKHSKERKTSQPLTSPFLSYSSDIYIHIYTYMYSIYIYILCFSLLYIYIYIHFYIYIYI